MLMIIVGLSIILVLLYIIIIEPIFHFLKVSNYIIAVYETINTTAGEYCDFTMLNNRFRRRPVLIHREKCKIKLMLLDMIRETLKFYEKMIEPVAQQYSMIGEENKQKLLKIQKEMLAKHYG